MQLSVWTYEGPAHVGAIRVAASMEGVHCVLHAPRGDSYADLLFTMIERRDRRPPVTYTSFDARDLGSDTAELVRRTLREAQDRFQPQLMLVGESCTAELLQDRPEGLARALDLGSLVVPLELSAYSRQENWGAAETFYQVVRRMLRHAPDAESRPAGSRPSANLLGPTALGFHCRDDVIEVTRLLDSIGVDVNAVAPLGADPQTVARLPDADINCCLYPEIAGPVCSWLERQLGQPWVKTVPIGIGATRDFLKEVAGLLGLQADAAIAAAASRLPWYSRSVDSTYLTGKRVFCFGDATHAIAAARVAADELGLEVVGLGSYSRELAREVRAAAGHYGLEALIADDYLEVESAIAELRPELVLGTQMERHIAKRLGIPCAVISAPFHVQDSPARYAPQMGFEGANVLFDTWVQPLMLGLEEHLLTMFRDDPEHGDPMPAGADESQPAAAGEMEPGAPAWSLDAERELKRIPFFVRGKARRNTELFARERGLRTIDLETLYDAKAHFGR